eukprot:JP449014.1.p2 GENE.JP449014.1~~JP449014.1.p2  ORF type:complete len:69 (+),score=19.22 JP449014.1:22-207(+)
MDFVKEQQKVFQGIVRKAHITPGQIIGLGRYGAVAAGAFFWISWPNGFDFLWDKVFGSDEE